MTRVPHVGLLGGGVVVNRVQVRGEARGDTVTLKAEAPDYSDSPVASSACARSLNICTRVMRPDRTVKTR